MLPFLGIFFSSNKTAKILLSGSMSLLAGRVDVVFYSGSRTGLKPWMIKEGGGSFILTRFESVGRQEKIRIDAVQPNVTNSSNNNKALSIISDISYFLSIFRLLQFVRCFALQGFPTVMIVTRMDFPLFTEEENSVTVTRNDFPYEK